MYSKEDLESGDWGELHEWELQYCKNDSAICQGCENRIREFIGVMQRVSGVRLDHWFCIPCFEKIVRKRATDIEPFNALIRDLEKITRKAGSLGFVLEEMQRVSERADRMRGMIPTRLPNGEGPFMAPETWIEWAKEKLGYVDAQEEKDV